MESTLESETDGFTYRERRKSNTGVTPFSTTSQGEKISAMGPADSTESMHHYFDKCNNPFEESSGQRGSISGPAAATGQQP